jgi:large subunit ribosomal protein L21
MYAVIKVAGDQVRVQKGDRIRTPRLDLDVGQTTEIKEVLLVSNGEAQVGAPTVPGALVRAKVLSHGRLGKIIVFKMKRRKKYRRRRGHRQGFTELLIEDIVI